MLLIRKEWEFDTCAEDRADASVLGRGSRITMRVADNNGGSDDFHKGKERPAESDAMAADEAGLKATRSHTRKEKFQPDSG